MWIFLNNAMFSAVQDRKNIKNLVVRARVGGDLERIFPGHDVIDSPDGDYRYRIFIDKQKVADVLSQQVMNIDYDNFKDSIAHDEHDRHNAYYEVWNAMHRLQNKMLVKWAKFGSIK